jgi:hypothetical protein
MMRRILAVSLLAASALAADAENMYMPDASDLWWNPNESGWGVNLVQQGTVVFATFFLYDSGGRAHWYVAPDMDSTFLNIPTDRPVDFFGALYETSGPTSIASFNPSLVAVRQVGTATFDYRRPYGGSFSFTIDGVSTTKQVERQTWRASDIAGTYNVNRVMRPFNCPGVPEASVNENLGEMTVAQSSGSVTIQTRPVPGSAGLSCSYPGTYTQSGRMGSLAGTFTCSDGTAGAFSMSEIQASPYSFSARLSASVSGTGCTRYGHIGGVRTVASEAAS